VARRKPPRSPNIASTNPNELVMAAALEPVPTSPDSLVAANFRRPRRLFTSASVVAVSRAVKPADKPGPKALLT
jgi:hypothetical protein